MVATAKPAALTDLAKFDESSLLGEIVTWYVQGVEVSFHNVREALTESGLDPDDARELEPRSAFSRACKHFKKERAIDKLQFSGGKAQFQFTKKHLADGQMQYDFDCIVELNCDTGDITCAANAELEKHARELFAHAMSTRQTGDITRLVQRIFEKHADLYAINPRGFAYFVPKCHREFTAKVEDFVRRVGGDLPRFPVPSGDAKGNASVRDAVESGLSGLIGELNEAVASWDENTLKGTMERAVERWEKLSFKSEAYAEYLGSEQERVKAALEQAKADLRAKVMALKPDNVGQIVDGEPVPEKPAKKPRKAKAEAAGSDAGDAQPEAGQPADTQAALPLGEPAAA